MSSTDSSAHEGALLKALFADRNKAQFAREHAIPGGASMLSQHLSGHRPISLVAAAAYARGLGVPISAFSPRLARLADDVQLPHGTVIDGGGGNVLINLEDNPDYPAIRRVKFKLSAGASGFGIEYNDAEGAPIVFQRQWYESRGLRPDKLFAVKVANGSMEPGLNHDDTVVVNTESTEPKDGVVFAVNYEGELVIKRLLRDSGQWWLSSDNTNQQRYPRKVCDEHCKLIGEIVHKQSERI